MIKQLVIPYYRMCSHNNVFFIVHLAAANVCAFSLNVDKFILGHPESIDATGVAACLKS